MICPIIKDPDLQVLPLCTREEAAELLKALRAAYQLLPAVERYIVKSAILRVAEGQSVHARN